MVCAALGRRGEKSCGALCKYSLYGKGARAVSSEFFMHPSQEHLAGLVFGGLEPEEARQVSEHVEQCEACEATIRNLEAESDTYLDALRRRLPPEPHQAEPECAELIAAIERLPAEAGSGSSLGEEAAIDVEAVEDLGRLGQYRLLARLGSGGMGTVYKALHVKLKRMVALKVLPPDRLQDSAAVARFEREMEAAGKVHHENIVAATDAGEHEGTHFLVMEYIVGRDLSQVVRQVGPLDHRLVHRDIKPINIILTYGKRRSAAHA